MRKTLLGTVAALALLGGYSLAPAAVSNIFASVVNGGLGLTAIAAHQVPVGTATNTYTAKTIPDCVDTTGKHLNFTQSTDAFSCGTSATPTVTTYQELTTAGLNQTYTTPAGVRQLYIRGCGAGGGGGGSGSAGGTGGTGGQTCFGTNATACTTPILSGNGGAGGASGTASSTGGSATGGSITNLQGAYGLPSVATGAGGQGAGSPLGSGGPQSIGTGAGGAALGFCAGGGGAGQTLGSSGGGAAGGYFEHIINSPAGSYKYTIGALGTAGTAGGSGFVGGVGVIGGIIVQENY